MREQPRRRVWISLAIAAAAPLVGVTACDAVLGLHAIQLGECRQREAKCDGETPLSCDATGHWKAEALCPFVCRDGLCVGECVPGDTAHCSASSNTPQQCNPNGEWQDNGSACAHQTCIDGECNGGCAPGEKRCAGTTPQACDPSNGACAAPNDTLCDDGSCDTVTDTCQGGVCNPAADYAWAHWVPDMPKSYVSTNDVVLDQSTGRTWQREVPSTAYTWPEANDYCASLILPGYPSGWRLPTRIELVSIVDYAKVDPAADTNAFTNTPSGALWSSSVHAGNPNFAWIVDFNDGYVNSYYVGGTYRVRCVR